MSQIQQMPILNNNLIISSDDTSDLASFQLNNNNDIINETCFIPLFSKANNLLINTGNVISTERLHSRTNHKNPTEEFEDILNNTLSEWLDSIDKEQVQSTRSVECRHPKYYKKIDPSTKQDVSISLKIFLNSLDPLVLSRAITTGKFINNKLYNQLEPLLLNIISVLEEIGADHIDSIVLAFPDKIFKQGELNKDLFLPIWSSLQNEKNIEKRISHIGLADFNSIYLQQVLDSLDDKSVIN
jgi:hypothetical protein